MAGFETSGGGIRVGQMVIGRRTTAYGYTCCSTVALSRSSSYIDAFSLSPLGTQPSRDTALVGDTGDKPVGTLATTAGTEVLSLIGDIASRLNPSLLGDTTAC